MKSSSYITASEIGDYVYCPRGWWLKVKGLTEETVQMQKGIVSHESLLKRIDWNPRLKLIALLLIGIGLMIFALIFKAIFSL